MRNGGGMRRCKKTIKEKKECFSHMYLDRSVDNVEQYKIPKKTVKRVVSAARG
jgi:ferredoxin-thioredoxin reductase catalytic subunit